jgi:hypothetical protein
MAGRVGTMHVSALHASLRLHPHDNMSVDMQARVQPKQVTQTCHLEQARLLHRSLHTRELHSPQTHTAITHLAVLVLVHHPPPYVYGVLVV